MSDPARLLSGEANEFEKELLGSWNDEGPSEDARTRVLAMVGLGVGGTVGTAAGAAKAGAAASGSIAPKAAAGTAALMKWLALGMAVTAVGGVAMHYRHRPTIPTTVAAPAPSVPEATPVAQPAPTADVASAPTDSPVPAQPDPARVARPARHAESNDHETSLGDQVSALDRARRAMADGNAAAALGIVADYEAKYPHGALVEEADVLRVEALVAQGDRAGASRAGARFLAAHPASPHAAHVRSLLGSAPSP